MNNTAKELKSNVVQFIPKNGSIVLPSPYGDNGTITYETGIMPKGFSFEKLLEALDLRGADVQRFLITEDNVLLCVANDV